MENILFALLPIFLLISLGYFFKRIKFPNDEFWQYADKFTYYVLFPSLLVYKLSTASLDNIDGFSFVSSALIAILMASVLLMLINKFMFFFDGASFTSIYQGSIRFNTYVFLALTDAIYGDSGLVIAALLMTFLIPSINIFCITIFSMYASSDKITFNSILKSIIKNPLIIACLIGGGMNYFDISLLLPFEKTLSILSSAALPLGLLSVGVGLHITHLKEVKFELFTAVFIKLALFPVLIMFSGISMGVSGLPLMVLVLFGAMPTASSAYILARELGGDLKLMSAIITTQTLLSIITISVILMMLEEYFV